MVRRILATTCFLWLMLGGVAGALQTYATSDIPLGIDTSTLEPGDTVMVSGSGFEAGSTVEIVLITPGPNTIKAVQGIETVLGEFTADADGSFSGEITIPDDFAGDGTLVARGIAADGSTQVLGISIENGAVGNLAFTGSGQTTRWLFGIGVVSIAAGSLMILTYRSRLRRA